MLRSDAQTTGSTRSLDSTTTTDHEYDVLGGYIPSFNQHLRDTCARLGLRTGVETSKDLISAGDATEEDTHSNWTPAERDAFFRAVSVHSRWRPDLIAARIPTKTEWEVWMYLEALEDGAAMLAEQQDVEMEDLGDIEDARQDVETQVNSDVGSHSGSDEDVCEPALEVSQAWIDAEERMASWIIDQEYLASLSNDAAAADTGDADNRLPKQKREQTPGIGKRRAQSRSRERTVSNKGSPTPVHRSPSPELASTSAPKYSPDPSTFSTQKREALMGRLVAPHLQVLDSILRAGEEAMKEKSKSREGSITAVPLAHGDEGAPRARDVDVSSLSDRITGLPETSNIPESSSSVMIDPILMTLSGGADNRGRQLDQVPSKSPADDPAQGLSSLSNACSQHPSLEVSSEPGTSNVFTFPQDNGILTSPDPNINAELDLLSPRSRRRIQKRLYMRRKRALLRGDGAASEDAIDIGMEKLKPGKKAKPELSETPIMSTSKAPSDDEAELPENVPKKNKPGLTLPYKLKAQFAELGIDAAYLRSRGMDLLNLGALGKLTGLYFSLEHGEEEADELSIAESIDAELIRHLQAALVSFVTDVIHRAIVWREREIRLKQRSQAWRHGNHITVGAVEHAVEAIGARYQSHKAYFKSLEAFHGLSTEAPANATEEEPNPTDASVDPDIGVAELPGLSLHRDVYTPLVYAPSTSPLACLTRTYEQEATRTRRGTSAEIEEDALMSNETDEEALEAELREEDEADGRDAELAATHESALWEAVERKIMIK